MASNRFQVFTIVFILPIIAFAVYMHQQDLTFKSLIMNEKPPMVYIGDYSMSVDIADTDSERELGLSGRIEIGRQSRGMLFIYPKAEIHGIWMKDMQFSIDIVWIDEQMKVIGIEKDVSPRTYPKIFRPEKPVKYVLETEAGYTNFVGIAVGKELRIPLE